MGRDQSVWFAVIDGREAGPMTRGEFALRMASDLVDEETFVWKEGMAEWLPAAKVGDLAPMFKARAEAKKRDIRPPPPPAAALAKKKAPVEEEIELELDLAPKTPPPPEPQPRPVDIEAPPVEPKVVVEEQRPPVTEAAPDRTLVEFLPFGELVHAQQVAKSLFTTGEFGKASGKTGKVSLDELKWAYTPTKKPATPQDAKAAALARAIQATAARPPEPIVPPPVTPAHAKTPPGAVRAPVRAPKVPVARQFRVPRVLIAAGIGFGAGLAIVVVSAVVIWLFR